MGLLRGILLMLVVGLPLPVAAATVTAYTPLFRPVLEPAGGVQVMLRSFRFDGKPLALVVDPWTLGTRLVPAERLTDAAPSSLANTPYLRTLTTATAGPVRLQNHGLTHAMQAVNGQFLTVDLCPSKRPFEQAFFEAVAMSGQPQPVPVAVAITGAWLATHGPEFNWLREQERLGRLALTWVNHSLTHPYDPAVPLAKTFLLTPGLDPRHEVLELEIRLLERGVVPSVFFRFPGLVADAATMGLLRELGLIPLGSDSWLAKGEKPKSGGIILVHGNGNEPAGIRRFYELGPETGRRQLLPLAHAVADPAAAPAKVSPHN